MSNIIFDIETIGADFELLPKPVQESLLKYTNTEEEKESEKQKLALWPLTGQIATIAILFDDKNSGYVFFQSPKTTLDPFKKDGINFVPGSEKQILKNFWEIILNCDKFITFNGRSFDCPFILVRSSIHKIKATRNLMPNRYSTNDHIDLLDQLTFYGAFRRKFPLDIWCRAFGIQSPKKDYSGKDVAQLFKTEKYLDIANYCLSDVKSTLELYRYWNDYINIS